MRIFKNKKFAKFAKKEDLADSVLCEVIGEMTKGIIHAELGGGVFKQRVARSGQGKRGGFRIIIICKIGKIAFFVHGFPKNEEDNITEVQKEKFRELAGEYLRLTEAQIMLLVKTKELTELKSYEKK